MIAGIAGIAGIMCHGVGLVAGTHGIEGRLINAKGSQALKGMLKILKPKRGKAAAAIPQNIRQSRSRIGMLFSGN
jgi:hypothetical protein